MLFVSLLQGFGLFPGRPDSAGPAVAAAGAEPAGKAVSGLKVPKQGITPKAPKARSKAAAALTVSEAKPGPVTRQRRDAVKKTAEKPASPAKTKATASKAAPVVPAKAAKAQASPAVKPDVAKALVSKAPAKSTPPVVATPAPVVVAAPVAVPAPKRGGRKAAAAAVPTPQIQPSHSPDAAKATFSHFPERVMTPLVHSPARKDPKLANNWKSKPVDQLTDEEVLSMPDAEYMNDTQMAFFRHKLVRLKQDILTNAGQTTENLREDTVVVPDPADRATIEEEHALELRTRDRERKLLKKIEQSIARIDSGDYGYCDETGEPIGVGRLIARPTASLSLEAQQRRELKQKMFGD